MKEKNNKMKPKNINNLFYGITTFQNRGCEAIVLSLANQIKKYNGTKIICGLFDYENNKNKHLNLIDKYVKHYKKEKELNEDERKKHEYYKTIPFDFENFERLYQNELIEQIGNSDLCFSLGGDNYCYGANNWLYAINNEIRNQNKKSILFGASLFEKIEDLELIKDLNNYDVIILRESLSYKALKPYVDSNRLLLCPDPAFSLEPKHIKINYNLENTIGLNISPILLEGNQDKLLDIFEKYIKYLLENTNYNIALIPHVYNKENNDLDALNLLKDRFKQNKRVFIIEDKEYDCQELKYIISKLKFLIAARTHASIAAYSSYVPTLVLGYSVKSKGIAKDIFGSIDDYVLSKENITLESLIEKFHFLEKNESIIIDKLKSTMPKYQDEASRLYEIVLNKLEELHNRYVIPSKKCTGCTACYNICPHNAIDMIENKEGFLEPIIIQEKCTECGLCKNTCPVLATNLKKEKCIEAYAAKNKNKEEQLKSSSGGIFYLLAKHIIFSGGVIYGATLKNHKVIHTRIDNIKDLSLLQKSKYVQSILSDTFKSVKKDLESKKQVLFSGTPCQVAGLKSYLKKEYSNLITISVICHGVPSPKFFKDYLTSLGDISEYDFKNKKSGWENSKVKYKINNIEKYTSIEDDIFMQSFLLDLDLRYSCYNCNFKYNDKNVSDIILGDYWGIFNEHQEFFDNNGVSAIIIQTEKGKTLFNSIKSEIDFIDSKYEKILKGNPSLIDSAKLSMNRLDFFNEYDEKNIKDYTEKAITKAQIARLKTNLSNIEKENTELKAHLSNIEKENIELAYSKENIEKELKNIISSKRWRLINKFSNILKKFFSLK